MLCEQQRELWQHREVEAEAEQQLLEQREALQDIQRALQDVDDASEDAMQSCLAVRQELFLHCSLSCYCAIEAQSRLSSL